MRIIALLENTSCTTNIEVEHGLSLYIEAAGKTMLFDTGATDLFAKNAKELGVDLGKVDFAVLSHGHRDHGGGIPAFFETNKTAPLYVRKEAFGEIYSDRQVGKEYIGLDKQLLGTGRLIFTPESMEIAEGISLFAHVPEKHRSPSGNKPLKVMVGEEYIEDSFDHEQNLVIEEKGESVLVCGCSHRGILNILDAFLEAFGHYPTRVLGGFHLVNFTTGQPESPETLGEIAQALLASGAIFYTCHCTGEGNYAYLKDLMGSKIEYLRGGETLRFNT